MVFITLDYINYITTIAQRWEGRMEVYCCKVLMITMKIHENIAYKMAEEKDVCSSSPARTPKLQLAAEQPATGECSVQFISVSQSCPTLCDPMDCSMPGFPVHCQLPEFTQTHVH